MNALKYRVLNCCVVALVLLHGGCGLRQVHLNLKPQAAHARQGSAVSSEPAGWRDGYTSPEITGSTSTFRYDSFLWDVAQFPCIRMSDGQRVMLDTGMTDSARLTPDLAREGRFPIQLEKTRSFAYVRQLDFGGLRASDVQPVIETRQWQFHLFGLPLVRIQGWWWWGMPLLRQANYLTFNNPAQLATMGMEDFHPQPGQRWEQYEMGRHRSGMPFVKLPLNGVEVELLADSGGGPKLILSRAAWDAIAPSTKVLERSRSRYPTWHGFESVDVYRVRELTIGPVRLEGATIWVRHSDDKISASLLGLGPLSKSIVVFDFSRGKLWISKPPGGVERQPRETILARSDRP